MGSQALVHFSGGSDSTLCASLLAESHDTVHLLTYDRLSFIGAVDYTRQNYERLCRIHGREKFVRQVVRIDHLHRWLCYQDYPRILRTYGLAVTGLCFSKLAMHCYSLTYSLEKSVQVVADGAVPYMELYPDQNEVICLARLRKLYSEFGIDYQNPVYSRADQVEQILYDRGILETSIRGTKRDKQVYYLEQVLLALFLKYYVSTHGKAGYESTMAALYDDRIRLIGERAQKTLTSTQRAVPC